MFFESFCPFCRQFHITKHLAHQVTLDPLADELFSLKLYITLSVLVDSSHWRKLCIFPSHHLNPAASSLLCVNQRRWCFYPVRVFCSAYSEKPFSITCSCPLTIRDLNCSSPPTHFFNVCVCVCVSVNNSCSTCRMDTQPLCVIKRETHGAALNKHGSILPNAARARLRRDTRCCARSHTGKQSLDSTHHTAAFAPHTSSSSLVFSAASMKLSGYSLHHTCTSLLHRFNK